MTEAPPSARVRGVTLRSVVIGLLVVVFVDAWATYAEMYVRASRMTLAHFPLALFATLLILLVLNRFLPKRRLSAPEFLVILSMGLVGAVIPVEGVVGFLLGMISSLYYFASPENQWAEYYHPYLAAWVIPQGNEAVWRQFFEGVGVDKHLQRPSEKARTWFKKSSGNPTIARDCSKMWQTPQHPHGPSNGRYHDASH